MAMQVEFDNVKNILDVSLDVFVPTEAAQKALGEYKNIISKVDVKVTILIIDCTNMGVFYQNALVSLEKIYKMYMNIGFKHIVFIKSQNPIQNVRLSRAAKKIPDFTGTFVYSRAEALEACL